MRDKLIELIRGAKKNTKGANCDLEREHLFADYLLENGVILPPCKVGDTVYMPWQWNGTKGVAILTVTHIIIDSIHSYIKTDFYTDDEEYYSAYGCGRYAFEDFGEIVFDDFEKAERALKERENK